MEDVAAGLCPYAGLSKGDKVIIYAETKADWMARRPTPVALALLPTCLSACLNSATPIRPGGGSGLLPPGPHCGHCVCNPRGGGSRVW